MTRHYDPTTAEDLRDIITGHAHTTIAVTGETVATGRRDAALVPFYNTVRQASMHVLGEDNLDIVRAQRTAEPDFLRIQDAILKAEERERFR